MGVKEQRGLFNTDYPHCTGSAHEEYVGYKKYHTVSTEAL